MPIASPHERKRFLQKGTQDTFFPNFFRNLEKKKKKEWIFFHFFLVEEKKKSCLDRILCDSLPENQRRNHKIGTVFEVQLLVVKMTDHLFLWNKQFLILEFAALWCSLHLATLVIRRSLLRRNPFCSFLVVWWSSKLLWLI